MQEVIQDQANYDEDRDDQDEFDDEETKETDQS